MLNVVVLVSGGGTNLQANHRCGRFRRDHEHEDRRCDQ